MAAVRVMALGRKTFAASTLNAQPVGCASGFWVGPRNAYLEASGKDWKCERGFRKADRGCIAIKIPVNAHLDYSGNNWNCDRPFWRQKDDCVQR